VLALGEKLRVLEAVVRAGVREIDVTSLVSPRVTPQFADAEDVLASIAEPVRVRVLAANARGADRAVDAHNRLRPIDICGIPFSASESHNLVNLHKDHSAHRVEVARMADTLNAAGIQPLLGVATAFGCPIEGAVDRDVVLSLVEWGRSIGIGRIMLGDTTGVADPRSVASLFHEATTTWPDLRFVAHFHDNRGCGIANALTAIAFGAGTVDASLGGVGGEPASVDQGFVGEGGNVVTEDLVAILQRMEIATGVDLPALIDAGALAELILGVQLHSKLQRTSPPTPVGQES